MCCNSSFLVRTLWWQHCQTLFILIRVTNRYQIKWKGENSILDIWFSPKVYLNSWRQELHIDIRNTCAFTNLAITWLRSDRNIKPGFSVDFNSIVCDSLSVPSKSRSTEADHTKIWQFYTRQICAIGNAWYITTYNQWSNHSFLPQLMVTNIAQSQHASLVWTHSAELWKHLVTGFCSYTWKSSHILNLSICQVIVFHLD